MQCSLVGRAILNPFFLSPFVPYKSYLLLVCVCVSVSLCVSVYKSVSGFVSGSVSVWVSMPVCVCHSVSACESLSLSWSKWAASGTLVRWSGLGCINATSGSDQCKNTTSRQKHEVYLQAPHSKQGSSWSYDICHKGGEGEEEERAGSFGIMFTLGLAFSIPPIP